MCLGLFSPMSPRNPFSYQANSLANDVKGKLPILSKVIKTMAQRRGPFLQDQDAAIHRIGMEHGLCTFNDENGSVYLSPPHFQFIVTRPSVLLQDGPSIRKLAASKSVGAACINGMILVKVVKYDFC
jgi:hypothetical protein